MVRSKQVSETAAVVTTKARAKADAKKLPKRRKRSEASWRKLERLAWDKSALKSGPFRR
jgi:hypothetical protein